MNPVKLAWRRQQKDFNYKTFDRTHHIEYEGGIRVLGSSSSRYFGDDRLLNPDQTLVGALSSCFMLTFLALASLQGYVVDSYDDYAEGEMDKNEQGRNWVARITIRPEVIFAEGREPSQKELAELFDKAHQGCFIANTIKSEIVIAPGLA